MNGIGHQIHEYFRAVLSAEVLPRPWPGTPRLAHFLTERYRFLQAVVLNHDVLFMIDEQPTEESPAVIRKHITQVQAKSACPLVYVREQVTAYNRKRLIEQAVPFVVPGNQMYLPELGIDLREHFRKRVAGTPQFRPATQAILIHALLRSDDAPLAASDLVPKFGYSSMTISRVFDELEAAELGESKVVGRERLLHMLRSQRETWDRALVLLKSPVKARHFIRGESPETIGPRAGLSALAEYSMLADPQCPVVAVTRARWMLLRLNGTVTPIPAKEPDAYEVEIWAYAPTLGYRAQLVDPLSLYLSLRLSDDERIVQALKTMMEGLPW